MNSIPHSYLQEMRLRERPGGQGFPYWDGITS